MLYKNVPFFVTCSLWISVLAARMRVNGIMIEREAISRIEAGYRFISDDKSLVFAQTLDVPTEWLVGTNSKS